MTMILQLWVDTSSPAKRSAMGSVHALAGECETGPDHFQSTGDHLGRGEVQGGRRIRLSPSDAHLEPSRLYDPVPVAIDER